MDGRFISDYLKHKVPNQKLLLIELERRGFETEDKNRILTTPFFGVPITALFLLLNENLDKIKDFQKRIETNTNCSAQKINGNELPNSFGLIQDEVYVGLWEKKQAYGINPNVNASGSMATDLYDSYFPVENDYGSLNSLYEPTTDNVEVYDDHLRVWPTETSAKRQFLIEPFKHIISFTEISYALSERIHKWETKRFTTAVKKTEFPKMPDSFDRVCNLRGSITHNQQNSLNFKVSAQNKLQLGKRDVEDFFEGTLVDLANWIDTVYYKMYQALVSLD